MTSALAPELQDDVLRRFLRYVRIDTQSDPLSRTRPSTDKQLDLCRLLIGELRRELGLEDVELTAAGHVLATLEARDAASRRPRSRSRAKTSTATCARRWIDTQR